MRLSLLSALLFAAAVGCGRTSVDRSTATSGETASYARGKQVEQNDKQIPNVVKETNPAKQVVKKKTDQRPLFDDKEMVRPINELHGYTIEDYRKLPNCLDVFKECLAVSYERKTSEQYKDAVLQVAQKPCRVMLNLVDVSADYDYADFELVNDEGESGLATLQQGGDIGNYTSHLRATFPIINIKKAKGLDSKRLSIGNRVVLVGMGYVVNASSWGAADPRYGMPRGDARQVMLRAFGKPTSLGLGQRRYEFSFMVRNWYIASQ